MMWSDYHNSDMMGRAILTTGLNTTTTLMPIRNSVGYPTTRIRKMKKTGQRIGLLTIGFALTAAVGGCAGQGYVSATPINYATPVVASPGYYASPVVSSPAYYGSPVVAAPAQPMMAQPVMAQPVVSQPMMAQPVMMQPMMAQPVVAAPTYAAPVAYASPVVATAPCACR